MKLRTYAGLSLLGSVAAIYHAFKSMGQFYPAMVYLSTSKINSVLMWNMGLVMMSLLWQLTKTIFLGSLQEAEVERLHEQLWAEIMEILFAITVFRQDFSIAFLAMITALLMIKSLNWLAQKRVEYIETTPSLSRLSHIRIASFLVFLLLIDSIFLYNSVKILLETRQASVSLFFSFEYMVLALTTISTTVKYIFYISDMLMQGQWEKKAVCTFYLDLIRDLLHLTLCMCFFLVIFMNFGVPLHLIRELYDTFRKFKTRVADYVRYRKITSNMNSRFPDATAEELDASDSTCIICREEMTAAKRLICGHLFHVNCLRSWLERQNTCPTCRAPIVPPQDGATTRTAAPAHGQQQGARTGITSSQGSNAVGAANSVVSQHQARLQAAASAAMLYEKSFVYPSMNTMMRSLEFALPPKSDSHSADTIGEKDGAGGDSSGLSQQTQFGNSMFPQSQHSFISLQSQFIDGQLDLQRKLINNQIEFLQRQMQLLQTCVRDQKSSDAKVKSVPSPSSSSTISTET
ncbi:ERAD-associated E3 ubiquitin-protein ligase HRD1B-like [Andrographis paniculata]|uniref:ERAD-associated E3 ubiquitin-protein ligase HRD1B-like n=1 Tax=Andrographis paniculata TaxID=175694 RepID=UPI0021E760F1|nr:ERAD-associated E3 ubiquitin-protein ligase HRD1B-like [Andrographis paniculata]XP_051122101.1 ERAD-associated E3 ubiquitin-protein ligase HRD1B-like [Andrographis paniculata]XP_051122102.1 ERAD-associated E3 ubiquitin-protein ligase HRD1B-like [Andrographis paniculata]